MPVIPGSIDQAGMAIFNQAASSTKAAIYSTYSTPFRPVYFGK